MLIRKRLSAITGHKGHDSASNIFFLLDQLETMTQTEGQQPLAWDARAG